MTTRPNRPAKITKTCLAAPTLAQKRRPRRPPVKLNRPWYDGGPGTPALPGEPCRTPPHPDWSEPEKWAWDQICRGEVANFNSKDKCLKCPLPSVEEAWGPAEKAERNISGEFLGTILGFEPWRSALNGKGIRIRGAFLSDKIELKDITIPHGLMLNRCRFQEKVELIGVVITGSLEIIGSYFKEKVEIIRLDVKGVINADDAGFLNEKSLLERIHVGNSIFMRDAYSPQRLRIIFSSIDGNLQLAGAILKTLNLGGTKINGELMLSYFKFKRPRWVDGGELILRNVHVKSVTGSVDS